MCGSSAAGGAGCELSSDAKCEDRAAIMVGLETGLPQVRIARSIGPSPSVMCHEITRHLRSWRRVPGPGRRQSGGLPGADPRKRLLYRDEALRRRVIADLSQGHAPPDQRIQSGGSANLRSKARVQHFPLEWRCGESNPGPTAMQQDFSGCSLLKSFSASASHAN